MAAIGGPWERFREVPGVIGGSVWWSARSGFGWVGGSSIAGDRFGPGAMVIVAGESVCSAECSSLLQESAAAAEAFVHWLAIACRQARSRGTSSPRPRWRSPRPRRPRPRPGRWGEDLRSLERLFTGFHAGAARADRRPGRGRRRRAWRGSHHAWIRKEDRPGPHAPTSVRNPAGRRPSSRPRAATSARSVRTQCARGRCRRPRRRRPVGRPARRRSN